MYFLNNRVDLAIEKSIKENPNLDFIAKKFTYDKTFENFASPWKIDNDPLIENHFQINKQRPTLAIVVGENGIGKTTSISKFAQTLRNEGHPVFFISPDKTNNFDVSHFFTKYFGTSNSDEISKRLVYNFYSQTNTFEHKKIAVLIIDNIDYCKGKDGKIDPTLLTFLNNNVYQQVPMSVLMVSSSDKVAYEINDGFYKNNGILSSY